MNIELGDIVVMKKSHPCGYNQFLVKRVGMDFKLECTKCKHIVMIPRQKAQKNIKSVIHPEP